MKTKTILDSIKKHAIERSNKICIADKKEQLTYKQMWELINSAAFFLKKNGIKEGDVVVIKSVQKIEFLVVTLAVQLLGATSCALEKNIKEDRVREIIDKLESSYFISNRLIESSNFKSIKLREVYEYSKQNDSKEFESPDTDKLAEIIFTTGTTGKSKGIMISHRVNKAIAENVIDSVKMRTREVELITTPISHALAIRRVYASLYIGSTAIITDGVKFVDDFFKLLDKYYVTAITFVPAILEQVLKLAKDRFESYKEQLNYIQLGSAPLSEKNKNILIEMFPYVRLYNTYGMTESACSVILDFNKYKGKRNCIGTTTINTEVFFVDRNNNLIDATEKNPGRMVFKGGMNMLGYYNDEEETKEVLKDGMVYTNDLGYMDKNGFIYFLGRDGDVINMGGIKIAPTEIEEAAMKHPSIKDCGCVPIYDEITEEAPKLFVELNDNCKLEKNEIIMFLSEKLEAIKVPKSYEVIDKIPRTFNGKIIRKELM